MPPQIQKVFTIRKGDIDIIEFNPQQFDSKNWKTMYDESHRCIERYCVYRLVRVFGRGGTFYNSIYVETYCSSLDDAKKYIDKSCD